MYAVLLVDDEKMALVSTRCSLDWPIWGFHSVSETTNPYKALELLKNRRYDAAFIDIRMPEITGLQLIESIQDTNTIPVVLTGYSDFDYARSALKLRAFDYCLKPLQPEDVSGLLPRLSKALWQKRKKLDPEIYSRLCSETDPAPILEWLGLSPKRKWFALIAVQSLSQETLSRDLPIDGEQAALLIGKACAVRLITCDADPSAAIHGQYPPGGANAGVAACVAAGDALPSLKKLLQHAVALANVQFQNRAAGDGSVKMFSPYEGQSWNNSFLNLLNEVEENYTKELSLSELSDKYNMNYSYCSMLFANRTGTTFPRYVNALRLGHAKQLLEDTSHSINEISFMAGYNNYNYFVNQFKKAYQMTPSQYRSSLSGGEQA